MRTETLDIEFLPARVAAILTIRVTSLKEVADAFVTAHVGTAALGCPPGKARQARVERALLPAAFDLALDPCPARAPKESCAAAFSTNREGHDFSRAEMLPRKKAGFSRCGWGAARWPFIRRVFAAIVPN
jgi:hypothetical protein